MAKAEVLETKKIIALEENTTLTDTDLFMVGNAGTSVFRKVKWANIIAAIKTRLHKVAASGSYNDLKDKPGVVSTTADGLAPKRSGTTTKFLRDDGTWAVPPDTNTVYTHPTGSGSKHIPSGGAAGQILRWSADGTAAWGADNDTKPVNMKGATGSAAGAAGYAPAPAAGAANRYLRSDGTWAVPPDTNTTYGNMKGATGSAAGGAGLVPAPAAGANAKYLRGDGTWQTPPDTNTTYGAATQSAPGLMSAADKKKLDGVAAGANAYAHPSTHAASMITQDSTHRFVSDTEKAAWNAKIDKTAIIQNATTAANDKVVSAAVAKNLQDQITEQNTKIPTLTGHTLRFDNGIQIYFMQIVQLTDKDANGYFKYFDFDLPFVNSQYCIQITNNTSNERVYMDNQFLAPNRVCLRCASSVWIYVMCIGYWK